MEQGEKNREAQEEIDKECAKAFVAIGRNVFMGAPTAWRGHDHRMARLNARNQLHGS